MFKHLTSVPGFWKLAYVSQLYIFPFTWLHLHVLWTACWWEQTRMLTNLSTRLSLVCQCSRTGWLKLAPRDKIRQYHGKQGWLISLVFNELLQCRIGVRAAKPFLSYSLQDSQVHRAKGQGWDPPLTVEWQLKKHFFHWGLLGIADWADLLPLACGLREGKRPLLPWLLQYILDDLSV